MGLGCALIVLTATLLLVAEVLGDPGVGVSLGRIDIEDRLAPGGGYRLPPLGVINTGDVDGDYEVAVTYFEDQVQRRPPASWLEFQPQRFYLNAGESTSVSVRLILPAKAAPGDYFALIEAHPVAKGEGVSIGVAAATKLTFTVKPSSWLAAQRLRLNRWLDESQPWSYLLPGAALIGLLFLTARRHLRFRLPVERRR